MKKSSKSGFVLCIVVSPARALDLFYRSKTCADLHNRKTGPYLYGCILPMEFIFHKICLV